MLCAFKRVQRCGNCYCCKSHSPAFDRKGELKRRGTSSQSLKSFLDLILTERPLQPVQRWKFAILLRAVQLQGYAIDAVSARD